MRKLIEKLNEECGQKQFVESVGELFFFLIERE